MKWNKFIPLISSLQGLLSTHEIFYTQFMGKGETNERTSPSNWWYVPPAAAGGFFVLVTAVLSPFIPIVFCAIGIPFGALAYIFGYSIAKESFNREKNVAKGWAWITCAWVSVIAWYVLSSLFWCELIGC